MLGEPENTAVQVGSNGIAEELRETIKRLHKYHYRPDGLAARTRRRSSIITNGIRIVRWVIARHGNITAANGTVIDVTKYRGKSGRAASPEHCNVAHQTGPLASLVYSMVMIISLFDSTVMPDK